MPPRMSERRKTTSRLEQRVHGFTLPHVDMPPPRAPSKYKVSPHPLGMFLLLLQVSWHGATGRFPDEELHQYCQWEKFNATCRSDEVVVVQSARYGRMRFGRCVREDHGHVGCSADVRTHLDQTCSGRHQCLFDVDHSLLRQSNDCPKEIVSYLEAEYTCVKVATNKDQVCDKSRPVEIESSHGYLSSVVADETGFGMADCPWQLRVSAGRSVKLTLINFAFSIPGPSGNAGRGMCETYMIVKENKRTKNITVCKGDNREQEIYVSESNSVQVHILAARGAQDTRKFVLKYEATGCPDLRPKDHSWVKRVDNTAIVKCNHTGETYFLTCEGAAWHGDIGNCSKVSSWKRSDAKSGASHFPYGLLVVIGIGVALGVAVGIILLMSILLCVKRRKERNTRSATTDPLLDEVTHENDENLHCNCPSKIYYSSRLELQRQLQRHAMEKATRDAAGGGGGGGGLGVVSGDGGGRPNLLRADPQSLPMPDMCIIETVPINEILVSDGTLAGSGGGGGLGVGGGGSGVLLEDDRREMQTSFITFKPNPSGVVGDGLTSGSGGGSGSDKPDPCKSCLTRGGVQSKSPSGGPGTIPIYDRRRREIQTSQAPYGTLGEHTRSAKTIYETAPRKNCAECLRDVESIYSTRQRELLNANNLSNSANSANSANDVSASKAAPNQAV